jgi:DNA-binding beta-propeller fold protein YncE
VDNAGNLYVAEYNNAAIRKLIPVGTNWVVTTLAGLPGTSGMLDGTGGAARFSYLGGPAVDAAGNVYVADIFNQTIRRVTPAGVVTTLGGRPGVYGKVDGWGSAARFWEPQSVAVDLAGNVYVADGNNRRITKGTPLLQFDLTGGNLTISNGCFHAHLLGPAGLNAVVEASAELASWTPVKTNVLQPLGSDISVLTTNNEIRFFRARLAP